MATELVSVLIAEDKEVMRLGLQQMIASSLQFHVVGSVRDADSLLEMMAVFKPRILLLPDHLPGMSLVPLVRQAKELSPATGVVVLMSQPEEFWTALESKADAYCLREVSSDVLINALYAVAAEKCYIGANLTSYLLHGDGHRLLQLVGPRIARPSDLDILSRREKDVIALLSEGQKNEEIARSLGLSIQTVKVHVKHILRKLNVSDRTQAVIKALRS